MWKGIAFVYRQYDCVPIVLYDRKKAAVGVVHAGWRGTVAGILAETLHQMNVFFWYAR